MESSESTFSPSAEQVLAYDDKYMGLIFERETRGGIQRAHDFWTQNARLEGIQYILRSTDVFGFRFETAYLSIAYLDRFLTKKTINPERPWAKKLLAMGCLSLAAKMEEVKVPPVSELFFGFGSRLQRMEFVVLEALEWRMVTITPFPFLHLFAEKLSLPADALSTAMYLILDAVRDNRIMSHRPSVMAAAATLVVLDQGRLMSHRPSVTAAAATLTRDAFKISPLNSLTLEDIMSCYDLFQEMEMQNTSK